MSIGTASPAGNESTPSHLARVALVRRGDPSAPSAAPSSDFSRLVEELAARGIEASAVLYGDDRADALRGELLTFDGVVVWVNPLAVEGDRSTLDPLLRDLAAHGVWVSTHPDMILKMGMKEILYTTRSLGWGTDVHRYRSEAELRAGLPLRLAEGPRVLKRNRSNGGLGVWKAERLSPGTTPPAEDENVQTLHALRGSVERVVPLGKFMSFLARFLADDGMVIDQAFQPRLPDGMIRCYMVHGEVAGFGQQMIKALVPTPPSGPDSAEAQPGPRIYYPPETPQFQAVRRKMEDEWIPGLRELLHIDADSLPVLWDADFLYGPQTADGQDTYVLCEINVSAVAPFPESAAPRMAAAIAERFQR
jgi:hypothetical protein